MTFSAIFAILVGVLMIGQWVLFYLTNQIPELKSELYRIAFHIAGVGLLMGGVG